MGRSRKLTSKVAPKRKPAAMNHNGRSKVLTLDALHDTGGKPQYDMRTMARCAIGDEEIPVEEIRDRIEEKFPGIDPDGKGAWKGTLRHTLSNYHCFVRVPRPEHEPGKGDYWKVVGGSKESRSQRYKKSVRSAKASARSASTTAPSMEGVNCNTIENVDDSDRHITYHQGEDYRHDDDWDEDVAIDSFHAADSRLPQLEQWRPQTSINAAPGFLPEISAMHHAFVSAPLPRDRYNTSRLVWDNSAASDGLDDYTRSSRSDNRPGAPFVPYHHDLLERRDAYFGTVPASYSRAGDSGSEDTDPYVGNRALLHVTSFTRHGGRWMVEENGRRRGLGEHLPPDSDPAQLSTSTSSTRTGSIPAATLSPARKLSYLLN